MNVYSQQFSNFFSVVSFTINFVSIQELNDLGYPIHFTRHLSPCLFNTFSIRNVFMMSFEVLVHKTNLEYPLRYNQLFYMSLEWSIESWKF